MSEFEKVKYVRQCCFSILPQVYCDRFSITEQIGKIVKALNGLIENNNKLEDYVKEIIRDVIESGEIEEIIKDMLANYILNVKFPPNGITPASGDGTKDDTLAIQSCIDYAFTNGGMAVYFPSGKYLTNSLTIKNNVTLTGSSRENTALVLKGGASQPLINGNITSCGIYNLMLDGNGGVQVNNLNVVDVTTATCTLENLIITDGYTLINANVSDYLQCTNIVLRSAILNGFVVMGNGVCQANNIILENISPLFPNSGFTVDTSNSFLTLFSKAVISTPIVVHGNGNKIIANVINNTGNAFSNYGTDNNIEIVGKDILTNIANNVTENISGNKTLNAYNYNEVITNSKTSNSTASNEQVQLTKSLNAKNLTETITETKTLTAENVVETVLDTKTLTSDTLNINSDNVTIVSDNIIENVAGSVQTNATDIKLNSTNPLTYKTPTNYNETFDSIPMKTETGDTYQVLVGNEDTGLIPTSLGLYANVKDFGAIGNGIVDDYDAIVSAFNSIKHIGVEFPMGTYNLNNKTLNVTKSFKGVSSYIQEDVNTIVYIKGTILVDRKKNLTINGFMCDHLRLTGGWFYNISDIIVKTHIYINGQNEDWGFLWNRMTNVDCKGLEIDAGESFINQNYFNNVKSQKAPSPLKANLWLHGSGTQDLHGNVFECCDFSNTLGSNYAILNELTQPNVLIQPYIEGYNETGKSIKGFWNIVGGNINDAGTPLSPDQPNAMVLGTISNNQGRKVAVSAGNYLPMTFNNLFNNGDLRYRSYNSATVPFFNLYGAVGFDTVVDSTAPNPNGRYLAQYYTAQGYEGFRIDIKPTSLMNMVTLTMIIKGKLSTTFIETDGVQSYRTPSQTFYDDWSIVTFNYPVTVGKPSTITVVGLNNDFIAPTSLRVAMVNVVEGNVGTYSAYNNPTPQKAPNPPSIGQWDKDTVFLNSNVTIGAPIGWICTSAGTPGTWSEIGFAGVKRAEPVTNSTATDITGVNAKLNEIIYVLKLCRLMKE